MKDNRKSQIAGKFKPTKRVFDLFQQKCKLGVGVAQKPLLHLILNATLTLFKRKVITITKN